MNKIDEIASDLREVLSRPSQTHNGGGQALYDAINPILADAGVPLKESRKSISEFEAWNLLIDCNRRVVFGRVLTGIHREYLIAILGQLLNPKIKSAREIRTFSKSRGPAGGMVRTEDGWITDPDHISDENIALEIWNRMTGHEGKPCSHAEAVAWVADQLRQDERHVARREAAYWKAWGSRPEILGPVNRGKGRPRKRTK